MTLTGAPGAGDGGSEPRPYRIILVDPQRLLRQLLRALREVTAGRWYRSITPEACPRTAARDDRYLNNRAAYLTQRQRQVLRSVALGYRTREIAQMLGVSVRAVHRLRERLRLALRLNSTAELTRFAVRAGFTEGAAEPAR